MPQPQPAPRDLDAPIPELTPEAAAPNAAAVPDAAPQTITAKIQAFRHRWARAEMLAFFACGFVFDAYMLRRIDDTPMLIQQGAYLLVVGALLVVGHALEARETEMTGWLAKIWKVADPLVHFMLGTLLNGFMIFYMKAASGPAALLFFLLIAALLAINELPFFHRFGRIVLLALFSFCVTSYFAYLVPMLVGRIRAWMFFSAVAVTVGVLIGMAKLFAKAQAGSGLKQVLLPGLSIQATLAVLYVFRLIPPVPLSVEELGIYHDVVHVPGGGYTLVHDAQPFWRFWIKDDREFVARPGDTVFAFVRVFAPRDFRDRIFVRWSYEDPVRGWVDQGSFPLPIVGGREEGYRGRASKANYRPGHWKVGVETEDGRTIDDLSFTISTSNETSPRLFDKDPA